MHITKLTVSKLFGLHDHTITLNTQERVTIVIGPNGFGKTTILKMFRDLIELDLYLFFETPFEAFTLYFDEDEALNVQREVMAPAPKVVIDVRQKHTYEEQVQVVKLTVSHMKQGKAVNQFAMDLHSNRHQERDRRGLSQGTIKRYFPELRRISSHLYQNKYSGQFYTSEQLEQMYRIKVEINDFFEGLIERKSFWLIELLADVKCSVLDTTRLANSKMTPFESNPEAPELDLLPLSTVQVYAQKMKDLVRHQMNRYIAASQEIDRTFTKRIIERLYEPMELDWEDMRNSERDIFAYRTRFEKVGLFDLQHQQVEYLEGDSEPGLDRTAFNVVHLHLSDQLAKYRVLDDFLLKLERFFDIINERFLNKTIRLNQENGLEIINHDGTVLDPHLLSSGEQHELVMYFELFFLFDKNTYILIDEPELSLHVVWQRKFLQDMLEIARRTETQIIITTHAPSIIDDRWDLTVELGGEPG